MMNDLIRLAEIGYDDRHIYKRLNKCSDRELLAYIINSHLIIQQRMKTK